MKPKDKIRLFMCCHKQYETIPPLYKPIQCGAALNPAIPGVATDECGINISSKNREYCELTAHYYAWKNISADHYGFCHYRRFFCVENAIKAPYIAKGTLSDKERSKLLRDEEYWEDIIMSNDIIAPRSEDMGIPARVHYITSKYHYAEDLDLFMDILTAEAPQLAETAEEYLSQNRQYFCNMFIMKAEYFNHYCELLFNILEKFDRLKTLHGDFQSDRTDGYLGELFTGIYIAFCQKNGANIKELPRLDVECSFKKRLGYAILPPESKRRFVIKKLVKKFRGK